MQTPEARCPGCGVARLREYNLLCANCHKRLPSSLVRRVHSMSRADYAYAAVRQLRGKPEAERARADVIARWGKLADRPSGRQR